MSDRYGPDHDVDTRDRGSVAFEVDMSPTSIGEEKANDGYLRTTRPMGGEGVPMPTAGSDGSDGD